MTSEASQQAAQLARQIYAGQREQLEREHLGKYVSIEPISGNFYLGETFDDAVNAALDAFPDRLTHTLRIGHAAALHLGVLTR
jgi:hypothetical protein